MNYYKEHDGAIEKEFRELKNKYENNYSELSEQVKDIVEYKFSKGGNIFFRGLYTPFLSFRYDIYSNHRGAFMKEGKDFTFKYGFNSDNQLIYVLRNLDGIYMEEFILYLSDCEVGLCFDKRKQLLTDISICKYNDDRLISVHYAHIMDWKDYFSFDLSEEVYQYDNKSLIKIEMIEGDTKYPTRYHSSYEMINGELNLSNQWITK